MPPKATHPCGTNAGYSRHQRRGEVTCQECCDAHAAARRARYRAVQRLVANHRSEFNRLLKLENA